MRRARWSYGASFLRGRNAVGGLIGGAPCRRMARSALSRGDRVATEFDVPVGGIDEVFPAFVEGGAEGEMDEGAPLWTFGLFDEAHTGLGGGAVGFAGVTRDAGADDVFPVGAAAVVAWNDVIEVEVFAVENFAAVLAGIAIAFVDVVPGELDFAAGNTVEEKDNDDPRNTDTE